MSCEEENLDRMSRGKAREAYRLHTDKMVGDWGTIDPRADPASELDRVLHNNPHKKRRIELGEMYHRRFGVPIENDLRKDIVKRHSGQGFFTWLRKIW